MNFEKIQQIISKEKKFRQDQIKQAIFRDLVEDWNQVTTLPAELRQKLKADCPLEIKAEVFVSKDGRAAKALLELEDGIKIESVLMRHGERNTVCVSSQAGCLLNCDFCATGKAGFKRNLYPSEIVEQVLFFVRRLKKENSSVNNIVFMGMGEPFLNYDNVFAAIREINDAKGLAIGSRHISISTVGIVDGIEKMSREPLQVNPHTYLNINQDEQNLMNLNNLHKQYNNKKNLGVGVNLAISLHAPTDELRSSLMPINRKYPIKKILKAVDGYISRTRRKVMFEYIMIKDINDSEELAERLAKIMDKPLYFVNLISYNPTGTFIPSPEEKIKKFKEILKKRGISATQRFRFGDDIQAACGQLAGKI